MISCIEFIPAYSVLFDFLEDMGGKQSVLDYWQFISDEYVEKSLGPLVREKGIEGCWQYWSTALNEEAADFTLTCDTEKRQMIVDMHRCPSKSKLLDLTYMKPYHDYCGHCNVIYKPVLSRAGISETRDHSGVHEGRCYRVYLEETWKKPGGKKP